MRRLAYVFIAVAAAACGGAAAREGETLPGRTRPIFEHSWAHPRDLRFAPNRFAPPDPKSLLVSTGAGLRAYVSASPGESLVQITAAIPLGRSAEWRNEAGVAEALSRSLSQQINEALGPGFIGRVQLDQDADLTRVSVQTPAADWRPALAAVVRAVREPRLDGSTITSYRTGPGFVRQPRGLGGAGFRPSVELARLLSRYPLAPPEPGLSPRPEAVRSLASRSFRPDSVVIGIGGAVTRQDAQRELETLTSGWQAIAEAGRSAGVGSVAPTAPGARSRLIDEPGYTTWIAIGHPMPTIAAEDEAAVAVMTDIVNIRLNIAVREMRGLANQAVLQVPATTRVSGLLQVRTGGRAESVAPLIRYALEELSRIRGESGAPTVEELEQVKGGLILGKWQASLDGPRNVSATYAVEHTRYGSLDRLMRWPDAVRGVTSAQVAAVATRYIRPDQIGVVVVGPLDAVRKARHPRWPAALDEVLAAAGISEKAR
jgi:predicted Zn-dependent peptidase